MLLFILLVIIAIILLTVVVISVAVGGAWFIMIFGDVIVCIAILIGLAVLLARRSAK